jgi:hypothetical protein
MSFEINNSAIRGWRLRLAQFIAPPGADVHDPDDTCCPRDEGLLEEVFWDHLLIDAAGGMWMNVTADVHELEYAELVDHRGNGSRRLTAHGEQELARLWGPGRLPPWSHGTLDSCDDHGDFDVFPGDLVGCRKCATERAVQNGAPDTAPGWSWSRLIRASR